MADQPVASKTAKQNYKRRARKKKEKTGPSEEPTVDHGQSTQESSPPPSPLPPLDPVRELKKQIEAAKAEKDYEKTQMLRQQLWALQDTMATGTTGPGAPQLDPSLIQPPTLPAAVTKSTDPMMVATVDILEKKISKLRKKLQRIEELRERQARGEKLEKNQIAKIETESEILDEIHELEAEIQQNQLR